MTQELTDEEWTQELSSEHSQVKANPIRRLRRGGGRSSGGGGSILGRSSGRTSYGNCYGDRCSSVGGGDSTGLIIGLSIAGVCGGVCCYVCCKAWIERRKEKKKEAKKAAKRAKKKEMQEAAAMNKMNDPYLQSNMALNEEMHGDVPVVIRNNNMMGAKPDSSIDISMNSNSLDPKYLNQGHRRNSRKGNGPTTGTYEMS